MSEPNPKERRGLLVCRFARQKGTGARNGGTVHVARLTCMLGRLDRPVGRLDLLQSQWLRRYRLTFVTASDVGATAAAAW
jgi:hypothetical protein